MKPRRKLPRRLSTTVSLILLCAAFLSPCSGAAEEKSWVGEGGDGLWSTAGNWYPEGVPAAGDEIRLGIPGTVTYDYPSNPGLKSLSIGSGSGDVVFDHSANTLTLVDCNGANECGDSLTVDGGVTQFGGYTATYNLSGTGVLVKGGYEVKIGASGLGYFNQSGGSFQLSGALYLGDTPTGQGVYTMTGGEITTGPVGFGSIILGEWGGTGEFMQSGGVVTVGNLTLARQEGSHGLYTLSGDPATATLTSTATSVGERSVGIFTQDGGTHTVQELTLGRDSVGNGTYNLNDGVLAANNLFVGGSGIGVFNQTGGTHTVAEYLVLGNDSGSGTYTLSGDSSVTLAVGNVLFVGMGGTGTFNQTGGTLTVTNDLNLGQIAGSTGEFNLSGSGIVNVGRTLHVGLGGTGVFTQSGDSQVNVAREDGGGIILASDESGTGVGTYNLHGGTVTSNYMVVGAWGTGTFNQTGGTNTTGDLTIKGTDGAKGTYNLSGGALNANNVSNNGTFDQTGGDLTVASTFFNSVGATANLSGASSAVGSVVNEGVFRVNGLLNITGGEFAQTAGVLGGSGRINGNLFVSGGTVAPGDSPGILTVDGNYAQGEAGILAIEILNGTLGSGYDQLNISGMAALDGTITLTLLEGYTITDGQTFDILHYGERSGEFAQWLGLNPDGSLYFTYEYTANDLILTAHTTGAPVPIPGAMWLLVPGLAGLAVLRKRLRT